MKSIQNLTSSLSKKMLMLFVFMQSFIWSVYLKAQEEGGELDVNVDIGADDGGGGAWYTAWWIWVVGIALFIIIIVAIVSAGRTKER